MTEYLLKENPNRYVTSDIKHQDIWDAYMNQRKAFWTEHEVDIEPDLKDWVKLNSNEKHFITLKLTNFYFPIDFFIKTFFIFKPILLT